MGHIKSCAEVVRSAHAVQLGVFNFATAVRSAEHHSGPRADEVTCVQVVEAGNLDRLMQCQLRTG